jgi:hypothetical protein
MAERRFSNTLGFTLVAAIAFAILSETLVAFAATCLLVAAWRYLPRGGGPPVLALAFSHQWAQANAGVFYYALTRRQCGTMASTVDWGPFVWMCNIALAMLVCGLVLGFRQMDTLLAEKKRAARDSELAMPVLMVLYVLSFGLDALVQEIAWEIASLAQVIIAFRNLRMFVVFLLLRRLAGDSNWRGFLLLIAAELLYSITGFFGGFREPLVLAGLAVFERFNSRKFWHWAGIAALAGTGVAMGTLWTNIKGGLRASYNYNDSRVDQLYNVMGSAWGWVQRPLDDTMTDLDRMVDRLWDVRYGALATHRVPDYVPHEQGNLILNGFKHILMPRLFFPEKEVAQINSDAVRKYCGMWVAGAEGGTSIAFGYIAEAYVDFGLPGMFVPILVYGMVMGIAYSWLLRLYRHRDIAVGACVVLFWAAIFKLEICWLNMFGRLLVFVVIGATLYLFDRMLTNSEERAKSVKSRLGRSHQGRRPV